MSKKPKKFDRNLVIIGAGSAGLVSAWIASAIKARVTLIEQDKMGGDCLNNGCVPSKTLIHLARQHWQQQQKTNQPPLPVADFGKVMHQVQQAIDTIAPHDSVSRYRQLGVECLAAKAFIKDRWHVQAGDRTLATRNIIIATGARPFIPPIKGLDNIPFLTSDNLWQLTQLPKKLLIVGGGPIGCELAQAFCRLGSRVTLVEAAKRLLEREDPQVSAFVEQTFSQEGIRVLCHHQAIEFVAGKLFCQHQQQKITIEFDQVLIAVGRQANTSGFGLEALGIELNKNRTIKVNHKLQSSIANIYACGDVAGPWQFTHMASHQAWYATVNSLFRPFWSFRADYRIIPYAIFTDPECARVGLNETMAKQQNIAHEITEYHFNALDRAITEQNNRGFMRVLTVPGKDKVLGVTIVAPHAAELLTEWTLAMKHGLGLKKILSTIHVYPGWSEANKHLAGNWMKAHQPKKLLYWLEQFHRWRR